MSDIEWIIDWITSSQSGSQGGNCVQVAWTKSSHCGAGDCVEVAWAESQDCDTGACVQVRLDDGEIWVRDSKDPDGPVLKFTGPEWDAFIVGVKDGEFNVQ
jgi:hypothetical protein